MTKIVNDFKDIVAKISIGRTSQQVFLELRNQGASRVGVMLVDSAMKSMPIEPLKNTLLLRNEKFQEELQNTTKLLQKIFDSQ